MFRSVIIFATLCIMAWMQNVKGERCPELFVWKRIEIQDVLISNYSEVHEVTTPEACGEICKLTPPCKSFGISAIFRVKMKCFLYNYFVWSSQIEKEYEGLFYYWLQSEKCPTSEGYRYNADVNFCIRKRTAYGHWQNQLEACGLEGGFFAIVDTQNKLEFMVSEYPGVDVGLIGGTRNVTGYLTWLDGSNVTTIPTGNPSYDSVCLAISYLNIIPMVCDLLVPEVFCEISVHHWV